MHFLVKGIIGRVTLDQEYLHLRAEHDGNCLFHAVGFLLDRLGLLVGEDGDADELRAKVVKWIKETLLAMDGQHELLAAHIFGVSGVDAPDDEIERQTIVERYLKLMATDRTWGDTLCVYALEQIYGVAIEVYGLPGKAPLYTPSILAPAHTLKLVCPAALEAAVMLKPGRTCHNHFDPLLPATDLATLDPSLTHDPGDALARTPWSYWANEGALQLYGPPVCHAQFHVSSLLFQKRPKKGFFSAFSSAVHIDIGKIVSQIHLVNRKEKAPLFSSACTAHAAEEAFRPELLCPLARASEHVIPELDLPSLQVLFSVKGSKKTHVCFRVYGRRDKAPRVDLRLSHEQIEERRAALDIAPPDTYEDTPVLLAAADVFSPEQWASLSWEDSPYQLVVAPCGKEDEPDLLTASWTYFQIPCAWDVDIIEAFANERLILMGDRLTSLTSVDGATVEPRTKETNATMELSAEEQSLVSLAMRGLGGKQTGFSNHLTNAIVEREDGRFFAMTSWASMVVLKRSRKTGNYYAHSLYYHSTSRALYVLRRGAMDLAEALREDTERLQALGKQIAEARAAASGETGDVGNCEGEVRLARQALGKEAGYLHDLETTDRELRGEGRTDLAKAYEGPIVDQRKKVAERSKALEEAFLNLELAQERYKARMEQIDESIAPLREEEEECKRKIREGGVVLQEWSILREPVAIVDGTADFDYSSTPSPGWCQISFEEDELPLTHAITSGISSCAGGVTFTVNDGSPDVILFWHIDASPTVPVKDVIAELYPDLEKCPALRSIVSIHPSVAEINKYRKDNMYPRSIRDRCETVFLARGSHLYDELCAVVCGSDDFGVDVTDPDNVCLVFTNDMDKRTYTEKTVDSRSESGLSIGLCDYSANIYGDYRFKGKSIDDTSALKTHLSRLFTAEVSEVTAHKAKHAKVCRLTGLGSDLFDTLQSAPSCFTVLDSPCFALGAKGDLEIGHGSSKSHYWWTPGPVLPPESKDEKEKEKGGEKDEKEKEKGGDELPPKKPVLEPAGRGPHSLEHEELEEWCSGNCHMCGRSPVRARYSCSPRCPHHHAKLCVPCGSGITMKTCSTCGADVELWDMSHNDLWR